MTETEELVGHIHKSHYYTFSAQMKISAEKFTGMVRRMYKSWAPTELTIPADVQIGARDNCHA